jgi:putative zinc finger/helix-turn-helix YgiT family protein
MKDQDLLKECAICGSKNMKRLENQPDRTPFKMSNKIKWLELEGMSFEKCLDCGEIYYSPEDLELLDKKRTEALESGRKKKGLLTAQEIKEIRATLGYSQDQLDKLLGFGARSFARWETYRADQSKAADLLLRALKSGGDSLLKTIISEQKTKDAA